MIVVSVVLLCLGLPYIQGQGANTYNAFCFPSTTTTGDPGKIEATFSIENALATTVVRSKAVHATTTLTCKTAAGTVEVTKGTEDATSKITEYKFTIDFAVADQVSACGVTTTGTTAKSSTFVMEVRYIDNTLGLNDADVTVTCSDWSKNPAAGELSTAAAVVVTGTATPKAAVEVLDSVSNVQVEMWYAAKPTGGAAAGTLEKLVSQTVVLGDDLSFRAIIPDKTKLLKFLKGHTLIADHVNTFDSTEKQELIGANGCGKPPFLAQTVFCQQDSTFNGVAANAPKRMYECGRFKAFSFPAAATANNVFLQLSVEMCATDACEVKSTDCQTPTGRRRKKKKVPTATLR